MAVWDPHYYTLTYDCKHPSPPGSSLVWISSHLLQAWALTAVLSGESGSVHFLRNLGLVMNEDLYDTGSAVVGLYRLFTNFLNFPGESLGLGEIHWGGGGGGGVSLGSHVEKQFCRASVSVLKHFHSTVKDSSPVKKQS